jgi:hypothetical protein
MQVEVSDLSSGTGADGQKWNFYWIFDGSL